MSLTCTLIRIGRNGQMKVSIQVLLLLGVLRMIVILKGKWDQPMQEAMFLSKSSESVYSNYSKITYHRNHIAYNNVLRSIMGICRQDSISKGVLYYEVDCFKFLHIITPPPFLAVRSVLPYCLNLTFYLTWCQGMFQG